MVTTEPDGDATRFVVKYGDYLTIEYNADLDEMDHTRRLALVLEAAGAGPGETVSVGCENLTGLREDDYVHYECRLPATRAGVIALLAARFEWAADARRLALEFDVRPEEVEEVRQAAASRIARERKDEADEADRRAMSRAREREERHSALVRELQAAEPNSARFAELLAELQRLHRQREAGWPF